MAKRFTDTEIWKKQFFKGLTQVQMLFWKYINDECDHSGVWYVELDVASIRLKEQINLQEMMGAFNRDEERVTLFDGGKKLLIKGFIPFQYREIRENNRLHQAALSTLNHHGFDWIKGVIRALQRPQYKGKDKEQDKDKVLEDGKCEGKKPFGEEGLVMLTVAEFSKLAARLGEKRTHEYIQRLENYVGSKGKRYRSHYHTILNWLGNDGDKAEKLTGLTRQQAHNLKQLEAL